jgi:hypothetical protein
MLVLLTPKREVPDLTSGRSLTTGSSLPLAEISAAGLLVAPRHLNGVPELPALCSRISHRDLLVGESLFPFRSFGLIVFVDLVFIAVP